MKNWFLSIRLDTFSRIKITDVCWTRALLTTPCARKKSNITYAPYSSTIGSWKISIRLHIPPSVYMKPAQEQTLLKCRVVEPLDGLQHLWRRSSVAWICYKVRGDGRESRIHIVWILSRNRKSNGDASNHRINNTNSINFKH